VADPEIRLKNGERIAASTAEDQLKYLGSQITPWAGLDHKVIVNALEIALNRFKGVPLKPHQKLHLISTHIIPHFLHQAVLATPPPTTICEMDPAIRSSIKSILHLPMSTSNGFLYCSKRDGGMGIPKLQILVLSSALKQGITLLNSLDPATHALMQNTKLENRLERMARAMRLAWPILNFRLIEDYKKRMKSEELKNWSALPTKGRGVHAFIDDRYGNSWL
jgi:hypothetical protein